MKRFLTILGVGFLLSSPLTEAGASPYEVDGWWNLSQRIEDVPVNVEFHTSNAPQFKAVCVNSEGDEITISSKPLYDYACHVLVTQDSTQLWKSFLEEMQGMAREACGRESIPECRLDRVTNRSTNQSDFISDDVAKTCTKKAITELATALKSSDPSIAQMLEMYPDLRFDLWTTTIGNGGRLDPDWSFKVIKDLVPWDDYDYESAPGDHYLQMWIVWINGGCDFFTADEWDTVFKEIATGTLEPTLGLRGNY